MFDKKQVFTVTIDNNDSIVCVHHDHPVAYEAHAIVMIESLKFFKQMSHRDAVMLYTNSTKSSRPDSFFIKDVIAISDADQSITEYDYEYNSDVTKPSIDDYWLA